MIRLIELNEFPTLYVDELDISKHGVYILTVMNGEFRPHLDNQVSRPRNAHLILWNLERPSGSAGSIGYYAEANRDLMYRRYVDEVWVSDRRLADETTMRYVTLGSDERLGLPGAGQKRWQFCHMSYEVPRRQTIYKFFDLNQIGPNCWPPERDRVLQQSKFALNVHQDHHPFQEPLRFALFAAYGLPIISETIYDAYPFSEETMIFSGYDRLVSKVKEVISDDYYRYSELGWRARELMCKEFQFGKVVRQAVSESVDRWR
ncbi:MAG: hypothetical protein ACREIQ_09310 [Nitrospiria bacterium]